MNPLKVDIFAALRDTMDSIKQWPVHDTGQTQCLKFLAHGQEKAFFSYPCLVEPVEEADGQGVHQKLMTTRVAIVRSMAREGRNAFVRSNGHTDA